MDDPLTHVLHTMLKEHLRGEILDLDDWIARYPQYSQQITEYHARLSALPSALDDAGDPDDNDPASVARSLALARQAMARGRLQRKDRELGTRIEPVRTGGATIPPASDAPWFPKFTVYAWIVVLLHEANGYCKRFRAQKVAYLVEQALASGLFTAHERFAAGPYDWALRYEKEGEPYAVQLRWFDVEDEATEANPDRRSGRYHLAERSASAASHAARFLKDPAATRELVLHLGKASNDELETLATVADLALELQSSGREVTTDSVLAALRATPEYKDKEARAYFSPMAVNDALIRLRDLCILVGIPDPEEELL